MLDYGRVAQRRGVDSYFQIRYTALGAGTDWRICRFTALKGAWGGDHAEQKGMFVVSWKGQDGCNATAIEAWLPLAGSGTFFLREQVSRSETLWV